MNITIIMASNGKHPGGMEKQVALEANYLAKRSDLNMTVIASKDYQKLFSKQVNFIPFNMSKSRRNLRYLYHIRQTLISTLPDIVHSHGSKATQVCAHIKRIMPAKIKWFASVHGLKKNNKALKHMDGVVSVSPSIQSHILPIKSECILNGVERCQIQKPLDYKNIRQELSINNEHPLILGVGRLAPVKRYDLLIQAVKDLPLNLIIVGDGPSKEQLESIADSNTKFTGYRNDIPEIMKQADLLVIASEREGLSLTLIEALLCELPVISTKVAGSIDILPKSCLINATNEQAIRQKIQQSLDTLSNLKSELQPVFSRAKTELTIEHKVDQLLNFYQHTVNLHA